MGFFKELYRNKYPIVGTTTVDIYVWEPAADTHRRLPGADAPRPAVSLIATVKNEGKTIGQWLDSIGAQSRPPDEIVIVDGGSTDDTWSILQSTAARSPILMKVLQSPGANIARGRNLAIDAAAGPLIAGTDAGCVLSRDWLAAISGPFATDDTLDVVAGYTRGMAQTGLESVIAAYFIAPVEAINAQTFLPSARSIAFTKQAWSRAGKFPEWLKLTAEDTLFDIQLKNATQRWAFVPEAQVVWRLKSTLRELFVQVQTYARGDGEAGLFPEDYRQRINLWIGLWITALVGASGVVLAIASGSIGWLILTATAAARLVHRIRQITIHPVWVTGTHFSVGRFNRVKATAQSMLVALTISLAMCVGFLKGVQLARSDDHS